VRLGNLRHEVDMYRALRLGGVQELLARGLTEIADTTEEVELEGGHGEPGHIAARDARAGGPAQAQVRGVASKLGVTADAQRGKAIAIGNAVLRPRLFHPRDGNTHVAIIVERQPDQVAQAWITEELTPPEIGGITQISRPSAPAIDCTG